MNYTISTDVTINGHKFTVCAIQYPAIAETLYEPYEPALNEITDIYYGNKEVTDAEIMEMTNYTEDDIYFLFNQALDEYEDEF